MRSAYFVFARAAELSRWILSELRRAATGDDGGSGAGLSESDGAGDAAVGGGGVGGDRGAGDDRTGEWFRQYRQGGGPEAGGFGRGGNDGDRNLKPQLPGQGGEALGIVDNKERRCVVRVAATPNHQGQFAADAGGFAHGDGEALHI